MRPLRLGFVAAAFAAASAVAGAAEPLPSFELHATGSLPLQYIQTTTSASRQSGVTGAPFGMLSATANLSSDWSTSVFAGGGHDPPGLFRDNNSTYASYGSNIVKRWGAFLTGASLEHTIYYTGSFATTSMIANDANLFARANYNPNPDLQITPMLVGTTRFDDAITAQRYSLGASFDIQQRLIGNWWFITMPRIRYSAYVNDQSGRRDLSLSAVAGLRYRFNDNVSFRAVAGVEHLESNVATLSHDRLVAGASLDFDFDLMRWR